MNKSFETTVLGIVVAGLAIAGALISAELGDIPRTRKEVMDFDDVKAYVKKAYKRADRDDISDEYRADVMVGVFNRNSTFIEENSHPEDHEELWAYNERQYQRYV